MPRLLNPGESRRSIAKWNDSQENAEHYDLPEAPNSFSEVVVVEEVCAAGDQYSNQVCEGIMIFLTSQGGATAERECRTESHEPDSLIFISGDCNLVEKVVSISDWAVKYMLLKGALAVQMSDWLQRNSEGILKIRSETFSLQHNFNEMFECAMYQTKGWEWDFLSRCSAFFKTIYTDISGTSSKDELVLKLRRLIEGALTERHTHSQLAVSLSLTPRQLVYRIHQTTGKPLATWIRDFRVQLAIQRLKNGQSVTAVSESLGFANPYHFSRIFRNATGIAPSAYSAKFRETVSPLNRKTHPESSLASNAV